MSTLKVCPRFFIAFQASSMPWPVCPETGKTYNLKYEIRSHKNNLTSLLMLVQLDLEIEVEYFWADLYSKKVFWASILKGSSALLTKIKSATSVIPRFIPWSSSPAPGATQSTNISIMSANANSDCPTPTDSTNITSKPASIQFLYKKLMLIF